MIVSGIKNKEKEKMAKVIGEIMKLEAKRHGLEVKRLLIEDYAISDDTLWYTIRVKGLNTLSIFSIGGDHLDVQIVAIWLNNVDDTIEICACGKVRDRYNRSVEQLEALLEGIKQRMKVEGKEI